MSDYISRDAARPDAFCVGTSCQECPFRKDNLNGGCRVDDFIMALPAADVAPVRHGTWLPIVDANQDGSPYQTGVFCSECRHCDCVETNYCPNCGAKMDVEGEAQG